MKEMDIKPHSILVRDLVAGYSNDPNPGSSTCALLISVSFVIISSNSKL